jgi:2,5-diamino-6-(ribosylamino)-4(3H)-pyrimidinone 5'-phosphate reductase
VKVITHNTVSVDGAVNGFPLDIALHYEVVGRFAPSVMLVGSRTAKAGIEAFVGEVPQETPEDLLFTVEAGDQRPTWVLIDSRGALLGLLHVLTRGGYASDVAVAVSNSTPTVYRAYLEERGYSTFVSGEQQVDLRDLLECIVDHYKPAVVLTDSGGGLNRALLREGLIDEVSLILAPELAGVRGQSLLSGLEWRRDVSSTFARAGTNNSAMATSGSHTTS